MKPKVFVVGLGEVGSAIYSIIEDSDKYEVFGYDSNKTKTKSGFLELPYHAKFMHICFTATDQKSFTDEVLFFTNMLRPEIAIIESTVPPKITERLHELSFSPVVYSPIRGMHPKIKVDIKFWTKYISSYDKDALEKTMLYYQSLGLNTKTLSPRATELAKLFETTYKAHMITFFQEAHRICNALNTNFCEAVDMIADIDQTDSSKLLCYPDVIGGHCLIPNIKLLLQSYDSPLLQYMLESNEKRKVEVQDPDVAKEIEAVKKMVLEKKS